MSPERIIESLIQVSKKKQKKKEKFKAKRTESNHYLLNLFLFSLMFLPTVSSKLPGKMLLSKTQKVFFFFLTNCVSELNACKANKRKEKQTQSWSFENYILKRFRGVICATQRDFLL